MEQRFGEPIARGFECRACGRILNDGDRVVDTKAWTVHQDCHDVTLRIVRVQKSRQGLHVPESLDELDHGPLETYLAMGGAAKDLLT